MRVVIAPDSFGGTLTASEAAAAIAQGWSSAHPDADLDLAPISDGGPGFVDVIEASLGGRRVEVTVRDPYLRPVRASLLDADQVVYVETAQACGLQLVGADERRPLDESTAGVGDLLRAASQLEPASIVAGLGGSATNDGGAGMLGALGYLLLDVSGAELAPDARSLARLERIDARAGWRPQVPLVVATDVDSPLLGLSGATAVFGPQKGASPDGVEELEACLTRLAEVARRDLPGTSALDEAPGSGAAGGLGYGLLALGGTVESGIERVLAAVHLADRISGADLVITGEGSFDAQSLRGKATAGVARAALAAGVPCIVLAGRVSVGPEKLGHLGVVAARSLAGEVGIAAATSEPYRSLARVAADVAAESRP